MIVACVCLGIGEALAIAAIVTACGGSACALAVKANAEKEPDE